MQMQGPLWFAVFGSAFVAVLYTAQHIVAARLSRVDPNERDAQWVMRRAVCDDEDQPPR
jgi:hypothetical protein